MNEPREPGREGRDFSELKKRYDQLMRNYGALIEKVVQLTKTRIRTESGASPSQFEDTINNLRNTVSSWLDIEAEQPGSADYEVIDQDITALEKYMHAIAENPQFLLDEATQTGAFPDLGAEARKITKQDPRSSWARNYALLAAARIEEQSQHVED